MSGWPRRFALLALMLVVLIVIANEPGHRSFGPYLCSRGSCALSVPMADEGTAAFIAVLNSGAPSFPANVFNQGLQLVPGDKIIVCNDTHCATYVMSDDDRLEGKDLKERTSSRDPGGQAGGREGGGGRTGGGGCVGSCGTGGGSAGGGTVNVGDPRPVKQET